MLKVLMILAVAALALAGCSDSSTDPSEPLTYPDIPGIVVFYDFNGDLDNETSGDHGATRDGRPSYTEDRHGNPDSALLVVTGGSQVQVADHPDLDITDAITLAAWVNPDVNFGTYNTVVDKDYNLAYSMGVDARTAPDTTVFRGSIADVNRWSDACVPIGVDTWTHIVFTYEDATGEGKFYANGNYAGTHTRSSTLGTSDAPLWIGKSYHGDGFYGIIDQVAIFDRALTAQEVQELYEFE